MIVVYLLLGIYTLGMLFIFVYSLAQGHLLFNFLKSRRKKEITPKDPVHWPKVTVQLPIFNEIYVVERLIEAASKINYPRELLQIQILDDSTDETAALILNKIKDFPEVDFQYLQRSDRSGFKAGALKEGLEKASGEFIAIFDADFVPDPDFLKKTIPYFSSEKIGMVQTRWTHLNGTYA